MSDDSRNDGLLSPDAGGDGARASVPPPPPPPPGAYGAPIAGVSVPGAYGPPPGPGPAARPPMRRRATHGWVIAALILLAIVTVGIITAIFGQASDTSLSLTPASHIGVITIEGIIRDGGKGGLFAGPPGARGIMEEIREAKRDSEVKAVLLLIDSPGGSPAASHAIWEEILKLKARKKVVVCMTDVCASGGYYIASAADRIVAQGSTLTGSIGVIMGGIGYYGLMQKLGLTNETLTAGKYKDAGSGQRPLTAEEHTLLTTMLQDVYNQFIHAVAEGRHMDVAKVRTLAEGRIYTGNQAKAVGLVDEIGNFYDAVQSTAKLAGITGEPKLKYYGESKGLLSELTSESLLKRVFSTHGAFDEMPLQGPMLVMPFTYQMVPAVRGTLFDLK